MKPHVFNPRMTFSDRRDTLVQAFPFPENFPHYFAHEFLPDSFSAFENLVWEELNRFGAKLEDVADPDIYRNEIFPRYTKFLQFLEPGTSAEYVFSCNFRVAAEDGGKRNLLLRNIVVSMYPNRQPFRTYGSITDITAFSDSSGIIHTIERSAPRTGSESVLLERCVYPAAAPQDEVLTKREAEILRWICQGRSSQEIADNFHLSINTVNNHRRNILRKTDCRNSVELMRYAMEREIV
mgnify:CR=1 FL=1